jgi:NTE family protein
MSGGKAEKPINLAIQGGGGHGAFAWGVLDRLLESGLVRFDTISATSGGAMNAAVMIDALGSGGVDLARAHLETLWRRISDNAAMPASADRFVRMMRRQWLEASLAHHGIFGAFTAVPEDAFSPLGTNPLGEILESLVDFERLRRDRPARFFVSATNARTGRVRIFSGREMTAEVIMASCCLPYLFAAVEIDGVLYWDGGYSSNPSLWPFFERIGHRDILLIRVYPAARPDVPKTPDRILNRINEITFENALLQELRAIDAVNRLIEQKVFDGADDQPYRLHRIDPGPAILDHPVISGLDNSWDYFLSLRDAGRRAGETWLKDNHAAIGVRGTFDLAAEFASAD